MPMYNASRYLRECIDSVLDQTFSDFEFIIVDDGSTDDSVAIVQSYADSRIHLIQRNHDYIETLNCLLKEANSKYIARIDADDIMLPNRILMQYQYMESHPEIDIIGGDVCTIEDIADIEIRESCPAHELKLTDFSHNNALNNPTTFMRTQSIMHSGILYDHKYRFCEDYKFWVDVLSRGLRIAYLNIKFTVYRKSPEQVSARYSQEMKISSYKVKQYCQDILANSVNVNYSEPIINPTSNQLTVIIPFLNEGEELVNTVRSIRNNWERNVEILVVNDHSYDGIDYQRLLSPYDIYYFYNRSRMGVAASRDYAISKIKTPYFLLLDGHMRLYDNYNYETICSLLSKNDRCVLCAQSIPLVNDSESNELVLLGDYDKGYGAYIPLSKGTLLPDIRWCDKEHIVAKSLEEIPTILGAGYSASVKYWNYLKGLKGLKGYGFDEVYISEKVQREGGKCLLLKNFITGHLYRKKSPYETFSVEMAYNSIFLCSILFPEHILHWSMAYAMSTDFDSYLRAKKMLLENSKVINSLKQYYDSIFTKTYDSIRKLHEAEIRKEAREVFLKFDTQSCFTDKLQQTILEVKTLSIYNGLGGILLYLIECQPDNTNVIDSVILRIIEVFNCLQFNSVSLIGFNCITGIGWLFLHMLQKDISIRIIDIDEILKSVDAYIVKCIKQDDLHRYRTFENGYGGVFCYVIYRIQNATPHTATSVLMNQEILIDLYRIAETILSTPGYDMRSYFMCLRYISVIENENDWVPSITDCINLNSVNTANCQDGLSLTDGILGYALLSKLFSKKQ